MVTWEGSCVWDSVLGWELEYKWRAVPAVCESMGGKHNCWSCMCSVSWTSRNAHTAFLSFLHQFRAADCLGLPGQTKHSEKQLFGWMWASDRALLLPAPRPEGLCSCSEASTEVPGGALHSMGWPSASLLLGRCASPFCIKYFKKWKM